MTHDSPDVNVDAPVDRVEVIQTLLCDIEHELNHVDTSDKMRAILLLRAETLRSQLEVL